MADEQRTEKEVVAVALSKKALAYIDTLVSNEGFGENRTDVVQRFVWDRLNELIAAGRLPDA